MNSKNVILYSRFPLVVGWLSNMVRLHGWNIIDDQESRDSQCIRIVEIADKQDVKTLEIQLRMGSSVIVFSRRPVTKLLGLLFNHEVAGVIHFSSDEKAVGAILEAAEKGEEYYDETILTFMLSTKYREIHERISSISHREMEIVEGILEDLTNDEIAERFQLSVRTVNAHKRNILQKMDERSLVGVVKTMLTYTLQFD